MLRSLNRDELGLHGPLYRLVYGLALGDWNTFVFVTMDDEHGWVVWRSKMDGWQLTVLLSFVTLVVYDLLGPPVATLINGMKSTRTHKVVYTPRLQGIMGSIPTN